MIICCKSLTGLTVAQISELKRRMKMQYPPMEVDTEKDFQSFERNLNSIGVSNWH